MIILQLPAQPPELEPKRRRLLADLHQIEQILRVIDLEQLQNLIDEQTKQFPEWAAHSDPFAVRSVTYAITAQQIVLLASVEIWRARKELPAPK